jgi:general transcription factor IIIA
MPSSGIAVINANLKRNMRATLKKHNTTHLSTDAIQWYYCDKCEYKTKYNKDIKRHKGIHLSADAVHGLAVITDKCKYKTKRTYNKKHLSADAVQWFCCDKCEFKTKRNHCLKQHKKYLVCLKRKVLPKNNVEERLK